MQNNKKPKTDKVYSLFRIFAVIDVILFLNQISFILQGKFDFSSIILCLVIGAITYFLLKKHESKSTEEIKTDSVKYTIKILVLFFPVGVYLMWKNGKNKKLNTVFSVLLAIPIIFGLVISGQSEKPPKDKAVTEKTLMELSETVTTAEKTETTTSETTESTETSDTTTTKTTTTTTTETTTNTTTETTTTTTTTTAPPATEPPPPPQIVQPVISESNYVLNTATMKAHKPTCRDVDKILPENREDYYGTLEGVQSRGYSSCGHCKPW